MKTNHWLNQNHLRSHLRIATAGAIDVITKNVSIRESVNRFPRGRGFLITSLMLGSFALSSTTHALLPPPVPDGGYPNGNTAEGQTALFNLTTGVDNTAIGFVSLRNNTTGGYNTATGAAALFRNIMGSQNTAHGAFALVNNSSGNNNTANGMLALQANTIGNDNTANGWQALASNLAGIQNTATGAEALQHNTTGNSNTADGVGALKANTTSFGNTATGFVALFANTSGGSNTASGAGALQSNTTGGGNVASGFQALMNNTGTGAFNTALGYQAGMNQTTGTNNVYIGAGTGGIAGESNACYIASIFGQVSLGGAAVLITPGGKLGTNPSSRHFKDDISPMDKTSEAILALKPVTFRYKKEIDPKGILQFGLVAEDVEKVNPDLVVRDKNGEIYSVRYDQVNAMLLNEFLKEHTKVEEQNRRIQEQEATVAQLTSAMIKQQKGMELLAAHLKEQDSKIEKVSAQFELSKPSPQTVLKNQ